MVKKLKQKVNRKNIQILLSSALVVGLLLFLVRYSEKNKSPDLPGPTLAALGEERNIQIGNFAILNHLSDPVYTKLLTSEFSFVLADNTPNWYFTDGGLRPSKDSYNFRQMDEVMAFAGRNSMPVQAHHFVWGEEKWLPKWLKNGSYTKQELMNLLQDHIKTVGSHYSGQIREWTVVNEAFTRSRHIFNLRDWWADNTSGWEYIDNSFIWARQADPSAKLILNDFDNEAINQTSNLMYDYVQGALERGVPIDGIGMQMHLDGVHPPTKDEVSANMKRFADLGLEIYVTEFDVNMDNVKASGKEKDNIQGNIYYEMMRACIESKVCHSFAYLGITDSETWYNYIGLKDPRPLMFDKKYKPKPAYYSTRTALEQTD